MLFHCAKYKVKYRSIDLFFFHKIGFLIKSRGNQINIDESFPSISLKLVSPRINTPENLLILQKFYVKVMTILMTDNFFTFLDHDNFFQS